MPFGRMKFLVHIIRITLVRLDEQLHQSLYVDWLLHSCPNLIASIANLLSRRCYCFCIARNSSPCRKQQWHKKNTIHISYALICNYMQSLCVPEPPTATLFINEFCICPFLLCRSPNKWWCSPTSRNNADINAMFCGVHYMWSPNFQHNFRLTRWFS